jgi:sugar lactone lactonase YvrE
MGLLAVCRNWPAMKKNLFLTLLLAAAFVPLTVHGAAGYLYESDNSTGKIFQFTTTVSGTLVKITFATGLTGVRGLAFDRAGNLFVGQNNTIIKITPAGFTSVFASGLHGPNFLAFDPAGNLLASDRDGNILRFTPQGVKSFFATGLDKPTGLAFDFEGNLFVGEYASNAVFKFTPSGSKSTFALGMKGPEGLTFDRFGILYVANGTTETVEAFAPNGSRAIKVFNLVSPVGLTFDSTGNLFIAEDCGGSNRITKFTSGAEVGTVFASGLGCPLQLAFEPPRDPLFNISTRARVEPVLNGELIGGFIITGTVPKRVLIRAVGPSLAKSGVLQPLQDPTLELHAPDGSTTSNDNWMDSQKDDIQATGLAPKDDRESAILASLDPGNYTAIVRGKPPFESGVALVEVYDGDLAADSTLANISSRGFVQTADNVMIAGFIVGGGNGAGKVLIRALGPSLSQAGVTGVLPDPTLSLFDINGNQLATNDDWATTQPVEIEATGIPPPSSLESAIVITLKSGSYTAIVRGVNGGTGVGLIEVYNLR